MKKLIVSLVFLITTASNTFADDFTVEKCLKNNSKKQLLQIYVNNGLSEETAKNFIRTYTDNSTETQVDITIKINPLNINKWRNKFGKDGVSELENRLKLTSTIGTSNMHMFDENCKITKFYNVESIIEKWFTIRKEIYIKRRDYLLNQLKKELDIIKFKVKFIEEIINDTILFKNVKKAAIILNLEEKNYPKISLKDTTDPSYDYLLGMDLYKLTKEEIDDLRQKKEFKESEYNTLLSKTATELWKEDIHEFIDIYTKDLKDYTKEHGPLKSTVKLKKTKKYKNKCPL